ncbi:MAG: CDGSH iron-sulfur domain-containing protein [Nitrospinota bacterium]
MDKKPNIYAKKPLVLEMEPGTYWWCACGKSSDQPFCDGSHKGSEFSPKEVVITEKKSVPWCLCKYTDSPPWCDGKHGKL